jgi:hypothetical protein
MPEFLFILALLTVIVAVLGAPLREHRSDVRRRQSSTALAELEAAREAKYREIRDAELDHQTGKLSDEDFEAIEQTLRAEAVDILHRLDEVRAE